MAWFLSILIVGSFGVVPVGAVVGAAANGVQSLDGLLTDLRVEDDAWAVEGRIGLPAPLGPVTQALRGPMEVIIGLQGRSLAEEQSHRRALGLSELGPAEQRAYVDALRPAQAEVRQALEAAGARVLHEYRVAYYGLAAIGERQAFYRIMGLPEVRSVRPAGVATIALDHSVSFLLGGQSHAQLGADGAGITIAVIDSGIDYTHGAFGGAGTPDAYAANDPTIAEAATFPTSKVTFGWDLVGEAYDARGPTAPGGMCSATPDPDEDPLDINGHGTHSASTAAGMAASSDNGTTPGGVAPEASLYAIKIFSGCASDGTASTSTANVVMAIEIALDPNGDGDTADAADVINMSLGGAFGRETEASSVASNNAVAMGVIVVASAGNAGNIPYITGSPAAASGAISVAAGNDPGVFVQLLTVAGSNGSRADGNFESIEAAFSPPLTGTGTKSGVSMFVGRACAAFPAGSLMGLIPLIERGDCTFVLKVQNVQAAGAVAAVVYNNVAGAAPIVMGGTATDIVIPAVMVGNPDGLRIRTNLDGDTTFTLNPANQLAIPDRLAAFTSRGVRFGDSAIKPDVTAPGVNVLSATVGSGTNSTPVSGTSFSAPHIAGAAALLRQLHPDWAVEEIKAALMNGATNASPNGVPYPVSFMGAGRARVDVAADLESLVVPSSASFGVEESAMTGVQMFSVELEVRNKGDAPKTFDLASAFLFPSDDEGSVSIMHPATLAVDAGGSESFELMLHVDFNATRPEALFEEYDGFLTLTETSAGGDVLRVPFHIIPIARASVEAARATVDVSENASLAFANDGLRSSGVDLFSLGAVDGDEDLIREPEGMPSDPDDWFDLKHTGVRTYPTAIGTILEFGLTVHGRRSAPNMMVTDIYIDVNRGGPDYVVEVADLGLLTTGTFDGRMASAVFSLRPRPAAPATGLLEFVVSNERNTAWQTAPILLEDLTLVDAVPNGPKIGRSSLSITYMVVTTDLETGAFDVAGPSSFNVKAPSLTATPFTLTVRAGQAGSATLAASAPGMLLAIYRNNVPAAQSEVISVTL